MRWPNAWWAAAAGGSAVVVGLLTAAGPVLLLPLLHRSRPLARDVLRHRLERLSARAGVPVLDVHELPLGERSRRASAALVGAGSTRRILLSDTLLANYSDDEIEVVMAHEMGHHVHRHTLKAMAVEVLLLLAGFRLAASVLEASWRWLGLSSPADVAGLPVVVLSVAGVMLLATPLLNAWSRAHERRADRFALEDGLGAGGVHRRRAPDGGAEPGRGTSVERGIPAVPHASDGRGADRGGEGSPEGVESLPAEAGSRQVRSDRPCQVASALQPEGCGWPFDHRTTSVPFMSRQRSSCLRLQ